MFEYTESRDRYGLKKLQNKQYLDTYRELTDRQTDYYGNTADEWNIIANGGYTEEERKKQEEEKLKEEKEQLKQSIPITTTNDIHGYWVKDYKGIVTGQVAAGISVFKDAFAGIRNVVGGRSKGLQDSMKKMREEALKEIKEEAVELGANAIVGLSLDFDEYAENMLLLTITGTAVEIEKKP